MDKLLLFTQSAIIKRIFFFNNHQMSMKYLCRFAVVLFFITFFVAIALLLSSKSYLVKGNLHDLWMPYIAAQAIENGMQLHQDFHTPFGVLYGYINYFALAIIDYFSFLDKKSLQPVSSILFLCVLTVVFYASRFNLRKKKDISFLFLLLAFATAVHSRWIPDFFRYQEVLWYGGYNNHLWALLIIQVVHLFSYISLFRQKTTTIENPSVIIIGLVQTFCCIIAFNYKISFFLSSAFLSAAVLPYLSWRDRMRYVFICAAIFLLSIIAVSISIDYAYINYFGDLQLAATAKKFSLLSEIIHSCGAALLFFAALQCKALRAVLKQLWPLVTAQLQGIPPIDRGKQTFSFQSTLWKCDIFFALSIGSSLALAISGDFQRPTLYIWIFFACYIAICCHKYIFKFIATCFILICIVVNIMSVSYISYKSFFPTQKYTHVTLFDKDDFMIHNDSGKGLESFLQAFNFTPQQLQAENYLALSYSYTPKWYEIKVVNADYIACIADAKTRIEELNMQPSDRPFFLEFANFLPVLFNAQIPQGSFHWIHFGTTHSPKSVDSLYQSFVNSDIVYVPTISVDGSSQTFLNTVFYEWNLRHQRFAVYTVNHYGILLIEKNRMEQLGLLPIKRARDLSKHFEQHK